MRSMLRARGRPDKYLQICQWDPAPPHSTDELTPEAA